MCQKSEKELPQAIVQLHVAGVATFQCLWNKRVDNYGQTKYELQAQMDVIECENANKKQRKNKVKLDLGWERPGMQK